MPPTNKNLLLTGTDDSALRYLCYLPVSQFMVVLRRRRELNVINRRSHPDARCPPVHHGGFALE
jgi:hypothetical protein